MKLAKVYIRNFKGLKNAEFVPSAFGCLVGENNAGKSSVLHAISTGLNRPTQLSADLFYDTSQPVEIVLEFSDILDRDLLRLEEAHRERAAEIIDNGNLSLLIRYKPSEKCDVKTFAQVPIEHKYKEDFIAELLKGKRGAQVREALEQTYPEFIQLLPDALNITEAKDFMAERISELPQESFELSEAPLPSGIPNSINKLLPEPIYIPAVKNLGDELKTSQSTSFGRLLGLLLEGMAPDLDEITKSFDKLDELLNLVREDEQLVDRRHQKVRDMENSVERHLRENFPSAKLEVHIPPPELKTVLNSAQIYIDDGSKDLVENKGDGIKRSLTFALLQSYVEQIEAAHAEIGDEGPLQRPLIFLFEEPELYLHPRSQRILFNTLRKIASKHQVVVTTHSPLFFSPGTTASFVRVSKEAADPKPVGVLYPVDFSLDVGKADTFKLAHFENANAAFFSKRVVLFEGESDDFFCRHVARMLNEDWDFDKANVALVRVSGKGNFSRYRYFFEAFGIEVKILADLDALFEGYEHLGAPQGLANLYSNTIQAVDARIAATQMRAEPKARQIKDRVQRQSWRERYGKAKDIARRAKDGEVLSQADVDDLDALFVWENNIARVNICCQDQLAQEAIVPLLDALRGEGICVLSSGAIEDYYPEAAPKTGPKPERALSACGMVQDRNAAEMIGTSLAQGRPSELMQVFQEMFRAL